ncbi:MAG: SDR family NAD(P)-dependent oxidoreductase [Ignavibacteria bacterium]|nr:SDR family NAD(P)-dependent oxidoreductase [Ignavibacteria bacterium]
MKNFIWITGASSGIGRELVKMFYRIGYNVFATARRYEKLETLKSEVKKDGDENQLVIAYCDVADTKSIDNCLENFYAETGGYITCLINNAGITSFKKAMDDSWENVMGIINTNLMAPVYMIRKVLPGMIEREKGTVINLLSVAAKKTFTRSSIYAASKSALLTYTNVLREEYREHNIGVLNVFPGATETEIWDPKVIERNNGKMMSAEDVARAIVLIYDSRGTAFPEELILRPISGDL